MKHKAFMGIMLLVAAMIFSAGGTCFAQPSGDVYIDTDQSGTTRVFYGPVFSSADRDNNRNIGSGATAYGIAGDPASPLSGATPFAIARKITDGAGNMNLVWPADTYSVDFSGATPLGSPAVIAGATNAFVVAVQAFDDGAIQVANFTDGRSHPVGDPKTGVTVMIMDGATMTDNWKVGIPEMPVGSLTNVLTSGAPYFPTQLTVWKPKGGTKLDATGVTIYGTSTADQVYAGNTSGASVWSLTNWGAPAGGGTWDAGSGMTAWPLWAVADAYTLTGSDGNVFVGGTGNGSVANIDGFVAAPVISGDSVFYVGTDAALAINGVGTTSGGITVYQLHKDHLDQGVVYAATVKPNSTAQTWSDRFMPTPVAVPHKSGASLFVVGNQGGVTVYDTQDLDTTRTIGHIGNVLLPAGTFTGVTASPVIYKKEDRKDPYIIMCGTSAVTCWSVSDGLASVPTQRKWWHNFARSVGAGAEIWGTPAVAGGYVWVPVVDTTFNTGAIYAFKITADPDIVATNELDYVDVYPLNSGAYASPIVVNRELWAFSYGLAPASSAQATKWDVSNLLDDDDVKAHSYWTQFKFDAAKTGDATRVDDEDYYPGDSSGCFLTTIK